MPIDHYYVDQNGKDDKNNEPQQPVAPPNTLVDPVDIGGVFCTLKGYVMVEELYFL